MRSDIYSQDELGCLGSCGHNVQIDRSVRLINPERIHVGSNVRIDALSFLSGAGGIYIGNNVHVAFNVQLAGNGGRLTLEDFVGVAARCSIFTASDDYSEGHLTGPTVPDEFKKVKSGPVTLERHVIVGCGSVILPNVTLKIGSSVGALSLVTKDVEEYMRVAGNPLRTLGHRNKEMLEDLEHKYLENVIGVESWLIHSED
jgi:dTDP-4-amino-4,6-dideoxy-D-glucose acyltransferase